MTYQDVLAVALATTTSTKFDADPERWQQVIADFQERFQQDEPSLLEGVRFRRYGPYAPYSEEVEGFFRVMARSGLLSLGNPSYEVYEMTPDIKSAILASHSALLQEHGSVIAELAKDIDEQVRHDRDAEN